MDFFKSQKSTRFCCLLQLFQSLACLRSSLPLFSEPAKSTRCNLEMVFLCGRGFNMFQPSGQRAAVTWTHQPRFRVDILTLGAPPVLGRTMAVDHTIGDVSDPFLSFCFKGTLWGTVKHLYSWATYNKWWLHVTTTTWKLHKVNYNLQHPTITPQVNVNLKMNSTQCHNVSEVFKPPTWPCLRICLCTCWVSSEA